MAGDNLIADPSRSAVLSPCGLYRYRLTRSWSVSGPIDCWIMLNPSTADAEQDDPTIRKICGFSRLWGAGGIVVVNLFAFRSMSPTLMMQAIDPIGPLNDAAILRGVNGVRHVVAAWGSHGVHRGRAKHVLTLLTGTTLHAITVTKSGQPGHPLYVSYSEPLTRYP